MGVTERQIDQIKKAEEAMRELLAIAAQLRSEVEKAADKSPSALSELREAAEKFEKEAQAIRDALGKWRRGIQ